MRSARSSCPTIGSLRIADLSIAVRCSGGNGELDLPAACSAFLSAADLGDFDLQIYRAAPCFEGIRPAVDFRASEVWATFPTEVGRGFVAPFSDSRPPLCLLLWDQAGHRADAWIYPQERLTSILGNLTLPFFAHLFAYYRALLIHAAAIQIRGGAWLVVGPSGSGKTHWARYWQERGGIVLDEDRVVLRARDGRIWAFGTPLHAEPRLCSPRGAPVDRVFFLGQTRPNEVQEVDTAHSATLLLRSTLLPAYDPVAMQTILDVTGQTVSQARSFLLGWATSQPWMEELLRP